MGKTTCKEDLSMEKAKRPLIDLGDIISKSHSILSEIEETLKEIYNNLSRPLNETTEDKPLASGGLIGEFIQRTISVNDRLNWVSNQLRDLKGEL